MGIIDTTLTALSKLGVIDQRFIVMIGTLRNDKELSADAAALAEVAQKAAETVAKDKSVDADMKSGLENLAYAASLAVSYLKDGTIPKKSLAWLSFNSSSFRKKFKLLKPLGDKGNATAELLKNELIKDPKFAPATLRVINKLEGKTLQSMRADKELNDHATKIVSSIHQAIVKISQHEMKECQDMRPAMENVGHLLEITAGYIKDARISEQDLFDVLTYAMGVRDNAASLEVLGRKDHPVTNLLRDEVIGTPGFLDACRGMMNKTEGSIFKIEPVEDGGATVRELITGSDMILFRMKPEHYAELQKTIGSAPAQGQKKPPAPPAPPAPMA